ncbi:hypothetical protein CLF_106993 [Clonorchis sinensis]|uniref:Uncharacterized protein n=1 Tax=Clonorchis sinensis TaxID=79923 RepID=G7YQA8_CLOSI|nr:hypothetical protein CLF_106993 [Clonorchis sinensis]
MADAVVLRLMFAGILMCILYLHSATCLPTSELLKRFSKEELEAKMKIIKDAYEKILDNRMQELNAFYQLHGRPSTLDFRSQAWELLVYELLNTNCFEPLSKILKRISVLERFGKRFFRGGEGRIILPDIDEDDEFVYRVV